MRVPRSKEIATFRIVVLLSLLFGMSGRASAERLPIKAYTTADGLAHNRVTRIVRDSRGFLWFCTADGLSRFDGARFTNYNVEDGLPSTSINLLLETRNGTYWVATNGGGVARLNSSTGARPMAPTESQARFKAYAISNEAATNRVNILLEDSAGVLWAGTDGGLFRMAEAKGEPEFQAIELQIPARPDISVQVWALVEGNDGSLWIGTKFGLVHRLNDGRMIHYEVQPAKTGDSVWSILKDSEGNLWLAHDTGVIVFKPQPESELHIAHRRSLNVQPARRYSTGTGADVHVRVLFQSSNGRIWASDTSPGLSAFDGKVFQPFPSKELLDTAATIAEDRDGNLWLGTNNNGALRIAMQGFTTYEARDGVGPIVSSVFEGHTGELYAISKWQISRLDGNRFVSVKLNLPRSVTDTDWRGARNVIEDHAGEWWVGTRVGLYRFGKASRLEQLAAARPSSVYTRRDGMADDDVTYLYEDSRGDLWIAGFSTQREVLTRWERATGTFHRYSDADGLPPFTRPTHFCEDRAGTLWIGFGDEGGLARYRSDRFTMMTESEGVPAGNITGLYLDPSGRLWFSQARIGSIYRIDNVEAARPNLIAYTKDDGLSTHRLGYVTGDSAGRIYVGNSRGIDQIDPATGQIRHYTSSDGLVSGDLLSAVRDRQGNLWFGTTRGLLRLIPRQANGAAPPSVSIGGLHVAGTAYHVSELGEQAVSGIELGPNQNQIQIDFFGLSFGGGESSRYQYKLEGASSDWSTPTDQRMVNYPNLAPGTYRFLVRAIGANGAVSEQPATVAFKILPPVWRRWWFLALATLLFASVVFAFARSRIARLRAARESDRRFRTLAETASDAIITIDSESRIILVNQAAERVFGYSTSEMLGKELTMLMPEYLRHLHREGFARYKQTGERHISWHAVELPGLHKSGSEIPLELSFGEFAKDDRRFFTGIARDITERKRAEEERKRAEEELRRSREERLRELERVRTRIATDLHDDIGSSLTQIAILSEVAHQHLGDGQQGAESLSRITSVSNELVETMSDIVWAINPKKDHLSDLVQRMRRFASDVFTASGVTLRFQAPETGKDIELGANIRREVFLIFKESVNNIVKHAGCTKADIEFQIEGDWLTLRVRDNGRGFNYSPADGGNSKITPVAVGGNGIPSMRRRAQEIGGRLELVSSQGQGTTATLKVLVAQMQKDEATTRVGGVGSP